MFWRRRLVFGGTYWLKLKVKRQIHGIVFGRHTQQRPPWAGEAADASHCWAMGRNTPAVTGCPGGRELAASVVTARTRMAWVALATL